MRGLAGRVRRRRKERAELAWWRRRHAEEGGLRVGGHYEWFFTEHFGLDRGFYAGKAILDVGCGPRGSLEWAAGAARRVGLDPLAGAYRELGTDRQAMEYVAAPAERMPFADASFDVVSCFNALDHVDDVGATAAQIVRVLRPGGVLLLLSEVGHAPRTEEPQSFGWEVLDRFTPPLEVLDERRLAHESASVYDSVIAARPWRAGPGILSARLRRPL